MDYAVWNPIPWSLFLIGLLICIISAKLFHRKYPDYPFGIKTSDIQAWEIAVPVNSSLEGNLPRYRVPENTLVSTIEGLLAKGAPIVGVEDSSGNLTGVIGPKDILSSSAKLNQRKSSTVVNTSGVQIKSNA